MIWSNTLRIILSLSLILVTASFLPKNQKNSFRSNSQRWWWSQSSQEVVEGRLDNESSSNVSPNHSSSSSSSSSSYDLSSPREWLEYKENETGNHGAYTVLRCDYHWHQQQQDWNIWGKEFHWKRLRESYSQLLLSQNNNTESYPKATQSSDEILNRLLLEAQKKLSLSNDLGGKDQFFTVMVTLLWQPNNHDDIQVFGHAFSTMKAASVLEYNPDPLMVTIALSSQDRKQETLPNRVDHLPRAKLSSWCRKRRPLEQEFKTMGVGEVLLVRVGDGGGVFLLEGLTSNLFAVYPGGVLRTPASDCVLEGYARRLVLEAAQRCGLKVEIGPIQLEDSCLWEELFLTSSIRLIAPIQKMIHKSNESSNDDKVVWSIKQTSDQLLWKQIYNEINLPPRL